MSQLDMMEKQVQAALRNRASAAVSAVRSETSLVKQASRLTGKMARQAEKLTGKSGPRRHVTSDPDSEFHPSVRVTADGYVRRSPVQPVREDPSYRARIIKKAVGAVVLLACVLAGLWFLMQTSLLAF